MDGVNRHGGWDATNLATGKKVRIKSAQRLRRPAKSAAKGRAIKPTKPDAVEAEVTQEAPRMDRVDGEALAEAARQRRRQSRAAKDGTKGADDKPKRTSALDAAAQVLKSAGKPMRAQELIAAMAEQKLWKSPGGKTPHSTLYAAVAREIAVKKNEARFRKTGPGQFAFNG